MITNVLKKFFVGIPNSKSCDMYAVYTDNEFFMNHFMRSVKSGAICNLTGVSNYEVFEYHLYSEEKLFEIVSEEHNIRLVKNNSLEIYESCLQPEICLYLSSSIVECFDLDYTINEYCRLLYTAVKYIVKCGDILKLPINAATMMSLLDSVYKPLILIAYTVDISSMNNFDMKNAIFGLLKTKGVEISELFNIYNVLDETLVLYFISCMSMSCISEDDDEGGGV